MRHLNPLKTSLSLGAVFGLFHTVWAALVAFGMAKPFMDFVLRLHFLEFDYQLAPFAIGTAVSLVALTFAIGAAMGLAFALIWNALAQEHGASPAGTATRPGSAA